MIFATLFLKVSLRVKQLNMNKIRDRFKKVYIGDETDKRTYNYNINIMINKTVLMMLGLFVLSSGLLAQADNEKVRKIDSLFMDWNKPDHPGGAVGIMMDGKLVFAEAYGLASLEYLVPNAPGTRFNIASISKQFTALAIVKLHLEGKLSIDTDIREYLPEMPDFGYKITCRHLLHHTSGLRSLHLMLSLAGWRGDDARNNDDLLRFMTKQKDLNFEPGSEYMYCNTGYILMAIIVERLTGDNFADWMKREVFIPLGMHDTYVEDRYNRVVKNNATSYNETAEGFMREVEYWGYTGSGNIHSTIKDILKWYRYYYDAPSGWQDAFGMMLTTDPFNDGSHNKYAFGVNVEEYLGEKRISHSGSIGGYRAFAATFPDKEIEYVVLTNFSSSNSCGKADRIASILLDKVIPGRPAADRTGETKEFKVSESMLNNITGDYWSAELETIYRFYLKDGKLYGFHNRHGEFELKAKDKNIFETLGGPVSKIEILYDKRGKVRGMYFTNSRVRNLEMTKLNIEL